MAEYVKKIIQRLSVLLNEVGMFILLAIMFLTVSDITGRVLFRAPILGTFEMTQFLLAMYILLGIAYTQQVGGHVKATLFVSRLPVRFQLWLDVFVGLLGLFLFATIAWKGWGYALNSFHFKLASDTLRIPVYPFLFFIPLGAGFLCLELLIRLITSMRELARS